MAKDFKAPGGGFDNSHAKDVDPKGTGVPNAECCDNSSHGNLAEFGPGPGTGANGTRIR